MGKKNYQNWTKKELLKEIEHLKKRKKYGLVWEDKPEEVVELCKNKLPVVKEVKNKAIITDKNKPVNLLIEGDNYHALSVLNYTHGKKIDIIYIDPPFNTGNKTWKYNNYYVEKDDAFRHSKWVSFMYKRLKLAKSLLAYNGYIVVAIDDYEHHTLRLIMDELFGERNRLGTIVVVHNPRGRNDDKHFATMHEYMLVYSRKEETANVGYFDLTDEDKQAYSLQDDISFYNLTSFMRTGNNSDRHTRPKLYYPIFYNHKKNLLTLENEGTCVKLLPVNNSGEEKTWRWGKETFFKKKDTELIVKEVKGKYRLFKKRRLLDIKGRKPKTVWYNPRYDASSHGIMLLQKIFKRKNVFPYPKSFWTNYDIIKLLSRKDSIILDFFAGSGTAGHAVLALNKEDNGRRQFILCTDNENSIAKDVCYPRIKRAIEGYNDIDGLGGNLKYFKADKNSFVDAEPTDKNKKLLTDEATEMLCIRESTFEKVLDKRNFKIFKNSNHRTGIILDQLAIPEFKKVIKDIKGKFSVYVFSLSDETLDEEFTDIKQKIKLSPIPEAILRVYRRIFR